MLFYFLTFNQNKHFCCHPKHAKDAKQNYKKFISDIRHVKSSLSMSDGGHLKKIRTLCAIGK